MWEISPLLSVVFQIGPARFRAPELLFRPDLIGDECEGIHEVLSYAIQKSDVDLRKTLYSNIVLSGGSTLFKGFLVILVLIVVILINIIQIGWKVQPVDSM